MSTTPIRILVTDADPLVRIGLSALIRSQPDFVWAGEASSGTEAADLAAALQADLVLMDLGAPGMGGVEATASLLRQRPQTKVVMLTSVFDAMTAQRAIAVGVSGFVSKRAPADEIAAFVRSVHAGHATAQPVRREIPMRFESNQAAAAQSLCADLTQRERDVLEALGRGLSNQAVAQELSITVPTVKFHVTNILSKLKVDNRTEAVLYALRNGLVELV